MEWVEKYRPKSMNDVAGQNKIKEELTNWIEEYLQNGGYHKPLLLAGPPGCGKTTLAYALANDYNFEVIELNASDKRNKNVIQQVVGTAAVSKSLSGRRSLIILDEVDGLSGNEDRGGVSEIIKVAKTAKNPIILTANDPYKLNLSSLRNSVHLVNVNSVHTNSIPPVLRRIALQEGYEVDPKAIKMIASHASGDLRAAINDLESLLIGRTTPMETEDVRNLADRDSKGNIFDAVRIALKTTHYDIAVSTSRDLKEDIGTVQEWLAENIPREYQKPHEIAKAYDYISKSDIYLGRVYRRQHFGFWKYASALMTAGVALSKDEKYRGFIRYSPPTIFTKLSRSKVHRQKTKAVALKIGQKVHLSSKRAMEYMRLLPLIFENDIDASIGLIEYFELTRDEVEFLSKKTIATKIFKQIQKDEKEQAKARKKELKEMKKSNKESNGESKTTTKTKSKKDKSSNSSKENGNSLEKFLNPTKVKKEIEIEVETEVEIEKKEDNSDNLKNMPKSQITLDNFF
ncbi:replication factor C large subunit [Methanococcus voltae PS]|uniref:Replication factor C large subunit n=1 Tax=Methanococcus voltae PS TaxID=523842 RepID=A0ABT2EZC1_METVO|nr:replication factor C large subunit [Methanococcus voltae]MCS3922405.1 replication factor C large subunit [Methanococcus voltae PS]